MEVETKLEQLNLIDSLFWSDSNALCVGNFISGKTIQTASVNSKERTFLWNELLVKTDFTETERVAVASAATRLNENLAIKFAPKDFMVNEDIVNKEEHEWSIVERSRTLLAITESTLRKFGIWDNSESRSSLGIGELRIGDKAQKSNFAETELIGRDISSAGYTHPSEGGPSIIPSIRSPQYEADRNLGDDRIRASLAHEVGHVLRALTNKNLWDKVKTTAERRGVRRTKIEKTDKANEKSEKKEKKKAIGGFYVASNMQGSEAVGEAFSAIVRYKAQLNEDPKIKDIIPYIYSGFKSSTEKLQADPQRNVSRYFLSKMALLDHLNQLDNLGFGDVPIVNFLSLGTFGYVSFEKIPQIIQLRILDQEKFKGMVGVVRTLTNWLTEDSQNI